MLSHPMDVLAQFPIRKSKAQKQAFRDAVQSYVTGLGYNVTVEEGKRSCQNVIIGDPKRAKYLVTAHYDTPCAMLFPNFMIPFNFFGFFGYQLLMIGLYVLFGFLAGFPVWLLTENFRLAFLVGYLVYMGLVFLMIAGPANKNNANDNTSGVVTLLEIARSMPENLRDKVCFILFDLEEAGLVGSASYRKAHKEETENQIVLNLDCVGDGDHIIFIPSKKLRKDPSRINWLQHVGGWFGQKYIGVREKGFARYNSDQKNFPLGIGIAALHKNKWVGLCCGKIHTKRDTTLEETNVNLLRAAITTLISSDGNH